MIALSRSILRDVPVEYFYLLVSANSDGGGCYYNDDGSV